MEFHSSGTYESTASAFQQRPSKIDPSSISITYAITATLSQNDVLIFKRDDFYDSRILLGEGATSTVFQTIIDPRARSITSPQSRSYRDLRKAIAIKQKRRRGSHIDSATPISAWLRAFYSDLRVMSHESLADCDNVVTLLGVFWEAYREGTKQIISPCLVMPAAAPDTADLESLYQTLKGKGFLAIEGKLRIFFDVVSGIAELHKRGIVHGDVKARNILIFQTPGPRAITAKIADFTHSIFLADIPSDEYGIESDPPMYTGTRPYCIPEVRKQHRSMVEGQATAYRIPASQLKACDMYGLGLLLLSILDDHARDLIQILHPLAETYDVDAKQTLIDAWHEAPDALIDFCTTAVGPTEIKEHLSIPPELPIVQDCFKMCLQHDPADRCTARELLAKLSETGVPFYTKVTARISNDFQDDDEEQVKTLRGSLLEFSYYMAQFANPKIASLQQTQIIEEAHEALCSRSSGAAHFFLACSSALGFGSPFNKQEVLHHLMQARIRGSGMATALLRRVFDVLGEDWRSYTRDAIIHMALEERTLTHWDENLEATFAELEEPNYFRERVRCLKITQEPYGFGVRYMLTLSSDKSGQDSQQHSEGSGSPEGLTADPSFVDDKKDLEVASFQTIHEYWAQLWDGMLRPTPWPDQISYHDLQRLRDSQEGYIKHELVELLFFWFGTDSRPEDQARLLNCMNMVIDQEGTSAMHQRYQQGQTPIAMACQLGHSLTVKFLLGKGADPSIRDSNGLTCLHWLAFFPEDDMAELANLLVKQGADVNAMSSDFLNLSEHCLRLPEECTPLHFAAAMRSAKATNVLIGLGADRTLSAGFQVALHSYKMTALHFAICLHFYDIVEVLLSDKTSPTVTVCPRATGSGGERNVSILHLVSVPFYMPSDAAPFARFVMHGRNWESAVHKTVNIILERSTGANICFDDHHLSAISLTPSDDPYVLRELLGSNARIMSNYRDVDPEEVKGNNHWSLVQAASRGSGFSKWCRSTADVMLDKERCSLSSSLLNSFVFDCAKRDMQGPMSSLFQNHLDPVSFFQNDEDLDLWYVCVQSDSTSVMRFLREATIERFDSTICKSIKTKFWRQDLLNPPQFCGVTPLYVAAVYNCPGAAKFLLDWGADPNVEAENDRRTPLCIAAKTFEKRDIAVMLLEHGANVFCNTSDSPGYSVLHAAIEDPDLERQKEQQFSMTRTLLESCPSRFRDSTILDSVDRLGQTALHLASYCGDKNTVDILISMGADTSLTNALGHTPYMAALWKGTFENVWKEHKESVRKLGAQVAGWDWLCRNCREIATRLAAAGSPLPPVEPVTGEYHFILDAAIMFTEWEGVSLKACFGTLNLPNLSRPGRPAGVVQDVNDPAVFIFLTPGMKGPCLIRRRWKKKNQSSGDSELVGMARSLSLGA